MTAVRLVKEFYFRDLQTLREEVLVARRHGRFGQLPIDLFVGGELATRLTMRLSDLYIVAFRGRDRVYSVFEFGGENYNHLGMPAALDTGDIARLPNLGRFRSGVALEKKLITIAAIVVAEAARFSGVSMHVQGLLSGAFTSISLAVLNKKYFSAWGTHSTRVRSGVFIPGEQLQVDVLL